MENTQNTRQIVNTVFKAVAVGMSVAAIVLGVAGHGEPAAAGHAVEHRAVLPGGGVVEVTSPLLRPPSPSLNQIAGEGGGTQRERMVRHSPGEFKMSNGFAIEAQNLKKSFGELQAVKGVTFHAEKGRDSEPARPQRRRQKHDHLDALRFAAPRRG